MKENGLKHVTFSTADGALEAAPAVSYSLISNSKTPYLVFGKTDRTLLLLLTGMVVLSNTNYS